MKTRISDIRKAPINPKVDFTKGQLDKLRESIRLYGFCASLVVCKDYESKSKYILLDGNSRFDLLLEMGIKEVDIIINDKVNSEDDLINFIAVFDNIRKKYDFDALESLTDRLNEFSIDVSNVRTEVNFKNEFIDNLTTFIISLPNDTIKEIRKKIISKTPEKRKDIILKKLDKIEDESLLSFILNVN